MRDHGSESTADGNGARQLLPSDDDNVNRAPPPDETPERTAAAHVAAGVARLGLVVRTQAWQARGRTGLTPTQAQLLATLLAHHPEPLTLRELAADAGVTSATASESLDALVGKGLSQRERSKSDARALAVRLTEAGRREATAGASFRDPLTLAAAELEEEEQAAFLRGLTRMIRRLQLEGRIATARICATCRYFRPNTHAELPETPHHCAFVDAAFGDRQLRIDCADHESADPDSAAESWRDFTRSG